MSILTQVCEKMREVLQTTADEAARQCGCVRRKRKLTGSTLVETLVFGWLETPDASYANLAQTAHALGIHITRQGIEQRMTPETAETLKATLEATAIQVLASQRQKLPLLNEFSGVYVQDSTWIALPDELHSVWKGPRCRTQEQKASLKLQLRFDVLTGKFEHFQLTDAITADSKAEKEFQTLPPGSLRLADLGYFSLDTLEALTQADVFWITRLKVCCQLFDEQGEQMCLQKRLTAETLDVVALNCFIGTAKRLRSRLVALRLCEEQTKKRRRDIRRQAKRRGLSPSKKRLCLAAWNIYITNIGADRLTPEQIAAVAGIRWQVELMFKCFKSVGKVHTSRSSKPYRILCEVYAKLIAQLIRHWIMLATGWRCLRYNIIETAKLITLHARALTMSFRKSKQALHQTFGDIKRTLQHSDGGRAWAGKQTTLRRLQDAALP